MNPVSFLLHYLLVIPSCDFPKAVTRLGVKDKSRLHHRSRSENVPTIRSSITMPSYFQNIDIERHVHLVRPRRHHPRVREFV